MSRSRVVYANGTEAAVTLLLLGLAVQGLGPFALIPLSAGAEDELQSVR